MKLQLVGIMVSTDRPTGFGLGTPVGDATKEVLFVGDVSVMTDYALMGAIAEMFGERIVVDIPDAQIVDIHELP